MAAHPKAPALRSIRAALGSMRSCVLAGETWTPTMQRYYDDALAELAALQRDADVASQPSLPPALRAPEAIEADAEKSADPLVKELLAAYRRVRGFWLMERQNIIQLEREAAVSPAAPLALRLASRPTGSTTPPGADA